MGWIRTDKACIPSIFFKTSEFFLRWKLIDVRHFLKERHCTLFFCHSHNDIGNVYLLFLSKAKGLKLHKALWLWLWLWQKNKVQIRSLRLLTICWGYYKYFSDVASYQKNNMLPKAVIFWKKNPICQIFHLKIVWNFWCKVKK